MSELRIPKDRKPDKFNMSTNIFPQRRILFARDFGRTCKPSLFLLLSSLLGIVVPTTARAVVPLVAPPVPKRVALADLVVIGKVSAIEEQVVEASPLIKIPQVSTTVSYRIAVVSIDTALFGAKKNQTKVRVAVFQPARKAGEDRPKRLPKVQFVVDQEGCFFLRKHPEESFFVVQEPYEFLDKTQTKDYAKEIDLAKQCARLITDVDTALEAKDANDRLLAASMLIFRFRTPVVVYTKEPKTEPIDAIQSKRILKVLAEADWTEKGLPSAMAPLSLFLYLGLTDQDGWRAPDEPKNLSDSAREWLRKNAGTYRIQRYVAEEEIKK
jgi:hypothetical protein